MTSQTYMVGRLRRAAEDMFTHTLDSSTAVVAEFAAVPADEWRVMIAAIRWPDNDRRVVEAL